MPAAPHHPQQRRHFEEQGFLIVPRDEDVPLKVWLEEQGLLEKKA